MNTRRTYWHLEALDRVPNDYDIATSRLLYYPERGFEVQTPIASWYARYQKATPFRLGNWEEFRDPRETTYTRYTEIQKTKEIFVDGLLRTIDEAHYDRQLTAPWVDTLDRMLPPLRFPVHGLQMVAAYLGSMAAGGRVTVCCALQAADEIRRIQRFAQRMRQLQDTYPRFGIHAREQWQNEPHWQELRRVVERLLIAYDWGEAFIALNLVLKPALDSLVNRHWARMAEASGDTIMTKLLFSLDEDARWHQQWSWSLLQVALRQVPENRQFVGECIDRWGPQVQHACEGLIELLAADATDRNAVKADLQEEFALRRRDVERLTGGQR